MQHVVPPLEMWGGIEPTIVRIGDTWRDQVQETGHASRLEDLDRIADLGIRTLRYPVLWESVAPQNLAERNWSWHDTRLRRLRDLGVDLIAGLVHHGSGPHYTNLLDPLFADKLAIYAESVAKRYPWLRRFTPVNEPLTTARFSTLYGHWYPHCTDYPSCLQALIYQCRAVVLAMQAIRRVTPGAELVQTEDLGRTFSTPGLRYQADFDNERRWLSFDLLCGRVDHRHPLHRFLLDNNVADADLAFFQENACPPDILGMNHYLTSDRYLDERLALYPRFHHGGNHLQPYADVEAVRIEISPPATLGPAARLREMWDRYHRPVAATEIHHGATRDEQLRWLVESWQAVSALQREGVEIRGFTAWALLGLVDWRSLLLRHDNFYEPGAFDVRSDPPKPTVLAEAIRSLARGEIFQHPVLDSPGWWQRPGRHYVAAPQATLSKPAWEGRVLLITGGAGRLAKTLAHFCKLRGLKTWAPCRSELDIADPAAVRQALAECAPWAVLNAAGRRPEEVLNDPLGSRRDNVEGAAVIARACARMDVPLVSFSTAQVFDGRLGRPYLEQDPPSPIQPFGRDKAEAEDRILAAHPGPLIIRVGYLVEPEATVPPPCLSPAALSHLHDLSQVVLDLLIDGRSGIWHLTHPENEVKGSAGFVRLKSQQGHIMPPAGQWLEDFTPQPGSVLKTL
jgi:dTDP-4-dehydrorhamnose reductase